jgi:hypothetical protein
MKISLICALTSMTFLSSCSLVGITNNAIRDTYVVCSTPGQIVRYVQNWQGVDADVPRALSAINTSLKDAHACERSLWTVSSTKPHYQTAIALGVRWEVLELTITAREDPGAAEIIFDKPIHKFTAQVTFEISPEANDQEI